MKVIKVEPKGFASNSYIITADNLSAVVVDPSEDNVLKALQQNKLVCKYVLLTHGHFDHVGMCGKLSEIGAGICCGEREKPIIFSPENRGIFGGVHIPQFEISHTFRDGEKFNLCGINFTAIHTPGHTAGSTCYLAEDCLFSGDTLFKCGVGRTDLPTGSFEQIVSSVKKLFALPGDLKVYSGHGEDTTLNFERQFNPYVR